MHRQRVAGAFVIVVTITILVSAQAPASGGSGAGSKETQACGALKTVNGLPNATTVITAADLRPAAGPRPAVWNGRFFFQGGGGANGTVGNALGALEAAANFVCLPAEASAKAGR